jgi:ribulose-phosphate 3-epimerase
MSLSIKILPSLLAADFGKLEAGARLAELSGADELHIDIMDGHFVPNLSMGPDVVEMARRSVKIPLSVHLMVTSPEQMIARFAKAGASTIFVHVEEAVTCDKQGLLKLIAELGVRPGITLNPETEAEAVFPYIGQASEILCMTVHPGYGGQDFIESVLPKIRTIRERLNSDKLETDIMVDGGINMKTAALCAASGANSFVAGTALYGLSDMKAGISDMRIAAERARR